MHRFHPVHVLVGTLGERRTRIAFEIFGQPRRKSCQGLRAREDPGKLGSRIDRRVVIVKGIEGGQPASLVRGDSVDDDLAELPLRGLPPVAPGGDRRLEPGDLASGELDRTRRRPAPAQRLDVVRRQFHSGDVIRSYRRTERSGPRHLRAAPELRAPANPLGEFLRRHSDP
jgi:hypothetical protein